MNGLWFGMLLGAVATIGVSFLVFAWWVYRQEWTR